MHMGYLVNLLTGFLQDLIRLFSILLILPEVASYPIGGDPWYIMRLSTLKIYLWGLSKV